MVAILGPGRLGEPHVAALASLRTAGLPTPDDAVTHQQVIQAAYTRVAERREVRPEDIPLQPEPIGRR